MNRRRLGLLAAVLVVLGIALAAVFTAAPALLITGYETTTVEAVDGESEAELASVEARIADDGLKRYVGLSATDELDDDEGMLFVHDEPGEYGYVMRNMAFAIDILFVAPDGEVTRIHEAEPESRPLTTYEGEGQYVLEVPVGWSERHGVEPGDRIQFALP
ncbi:uncharacterized membrane protein (UPF0127 family) [Halorubrum alkaliphilum]|uniref:Uncharacterized membrane protein (UPF0127 family) n=1 Tax=Halorubrum alkaliphilum TaxID=261290 RepID=A0A8T4GE77_9EURY|nr:DUF192 domain-containing protein [Halorubrum alkaliphilum]MBP1921771.1 uncharacterized membrane protein (UPF0127 family) [Halorubrum alkaliphilum]